MTEYEWKCERCGDVATGPYRPAGGHPCRLCCSCTVETTQITFRTRGGPCKVARPKAPPTPPVWDGLDLVAETRRLIDLEINPDRLRFNPPELRLKIFAKEPTSMDGWASRGRNLVVLFAWPGATAGHVLCTLVHELGHFVTGNRHDDGFRMHMLEMVREAYGVEPPMPAGYAQHHFDSAIQIALEGWCEGQVQS